MGGKLGLQVCSNLKAEKMSDLAKYSAGELQARFGDKTGCVVIYYSYRQKLKRS